MQEGSLKLLLWEGYWGCEGWPRCTAQEQYAYERAVAYQPLQFSVAGACSAAGAGPRALRGPVAHPAAVSCFWCPCTGGSSGPISHVTQPWWAERLPSALQAVQHAQTWPRSLGTPENAPCALAGLFLWRHRAYMSWADVDEFLLIPQPGHMVGDLLASPECYAGAAQIGVPHYQARGSGSCFCTWARC